MFSYFTSEYFHYLCIACHFGSFLALTLFMAMDDLVSADGKMQIYILKPQEGSVFTGYVMEPLWNPSIFGFLASFAFITAGFHIYYVMTINTHDSTVRFLEYFFTASLMSSVISLLVGIRDVYALMTIEGLIATTMIFGYLEEKTVNLSLTLRPYYLGYVPYITAWIPIIWQFIRVALVNEELPDFVIAVFATQIALFTCFGVVQYLYVVRPREITEPLEMEGLYNLLSLTSKMLLIWLCAGGLIAQTS